MINELYIINQSLLMIWLLEECVFVVFFIY